MKTPQLAHGYHELYDEGNIKIEETHPNKYIENLEK
jgi:hypothetical protein